MSLAAGTRIGPYEVISMAGAGGMGEVYRATDTNLKRTVALKVLPESIAGERERLARFQREAEVLASLNHPNIAAIYGLERTDRATALVMEMVDGPTLAERIAGGPIPLDEALPIARQIAEAMEAAHEHGIIHRDLKPANIKVRPDGTVKVLDFGLAKALDPAAPSGTAARLESLATVTSPAMTRQGMILGTAAYMSPEQARGLVLDRRTDIWAFGCLLYEMLTARKPFEGETVSDAIAAILGREADWTALPSAMPAAIERLLRRCLQKDRRHRLADAGDARLEIEEAQSSPVRSSHGVGLQPQALALQHRRQILRPALPMLLTLAVGTAVGVLTTREWLGVDSSSVAWVPTFTRITDQPGTERAPSLSPDGKTVVYVSDASGNDDVYLLRVGGQNPINLTANSSAAESAPAFSPDGSHIAFRSERSGGGIYVMGATGESVRRVTDFGFDPSWAPDSKSMVVSTIAVTTPFERTGQGRLHVVDAATGESRELPTSEDAMQPSWSPHGQRIAYWGMETESGRRDLWTVRSDGAGQPVRLTADPHVDWRPVWSADGSHLYFLSDRSGVMNLWRVPIAEATGQPLRDPEALTTPTQFITGLSIGKNSALAFSAADPRSTLQRIDFDSVGQAVVGAPVVLLQSPRRIRWLDVSPDGKWILFSASGPGDNLYVIGVDGSNYRQITSGNSLNRGGRWHPDGSRILFYSNRSGSYQAWQVGFDGGGLQQLTNIAGSVVLPIVSPRLDRFAFASTTATGRDEVHVGTFAALQDALQDNSREARPTPVTNVRSHLTPSPPKGFLIPSSWSPDGTLLAEFLAPPDGGLFMYSLKSDRHDDLQVVGQDPRWLPDGRRLMFHDSTRVFLLDIASGRTRVIFQVAARMQLPNFGFTLSLDGRQIVLVASEEPSDLWLMNFN